MTEAGSYGQPDISEGLLLLERSPQDAAPSCTIEEAAAPDNPAPPPLGWTQDGQIIFQIKNHLTKGKDVYFILHDFVYIMKVNVSK